MTPVPCPLQSYIYRGEVIRVVDGDTVIIVIDLGFRIEITQSCRMVDLNTPEMHGGERRAGLFAKEYVIDRLLGRKVIIATSKSDAFGRWLVRIWIETNGVMVDFNSELVNLGYAVAYRDGKGGA